ncbi:MAG: lytic transglycosylase domain-containing protein [Candidatus Roizmanbacteria bacterium]|nr:lytic transglycosylase domain-containing protein [Candidatus Roizmanbacteria bacterium]
MNWRIIASILLLIAAGGFAVTAWAIPEINRKRAAPFLAAFASAESKYGLPPDLLNRVAYQESRYNPAAVSLVGAKGLMQFMPATAKDFGIDPLDPFQSIDAAGKYLAQLFKMFNSWPLAIAAYNWGPGNMRKHLTKHGGLNVAALPDETRKYLSIATDIGVS